MLRFIIIIFSLFSISILNIRAEHANRKNTEHSEFKVINGKFTLDSEPFIIKAAELHYPRIPKEYWDHRIKLSKALGMNTICLYAFWNFHEEKEDLFDFSGQKDIREFIELCEENGMKVILRPGPYVCAEWEMGGLPWWLLKHKDIRLRENDPYFLERVKRFQEALAQQVSDLTIDKGGPILMIQVENEYGAYGEDKEYVGNIRDILKSLYGEEILMFQCDWSSNFTVNGLDDLLWTMNFGTGADIDAQFEELKRLRPDSPLMCSEYWSGWFDKWGAEHETRDAGEMIAGIDEMLSKDISFSLYMTHGGTNWSHWAGANSPGYSPDVTSYDYDAPINEYGHPTEKFWLLREILSKHQSGNEKIPDLPDLIEPVSINNFELTSVAPLFDNLPEAQLSDIIKPMEDFDMGYGSILYSTKLPAIEEGAKLIINEPHDFAQIFIDNKLVGILDRREGQSELVIGKNFGEARLDILVEATGRINFGREIKDYKGITNNVLIIHPSSCDTIELKGWEVTLFPDEYDFYRNLNFKTIDSKAFDNLTYPRGVYKGTFNVEYPSDTFLNFESWGKGLVYINGTGIGRIWSIGPQQTLYVPGSWLKEGENEILIFDILGPRSLTVEGVDQPIIDKIQNFRLEEINASIEEFNFAEVNESIEGSFENSTGWQEFIFDQPIKGRYIALMIDSSFDKDNFIAISELYLLDENGIRHNRDKWKAISDNGTVLRGNHTADKAFDLQESTYWQSEVRENNNPYIIIDLGKEEIISGLQQLPRVDKGNPGAVKAFGIYVK